MKPDKALEILEGKVPHKEIHDNAPSYLKYTASPKSKQPQPARVSKAGAWLRGFMLVLVLASLPAVYYWSIKVSDKSYQSGFNDGAVSIRSNIASAQKDIIDKVQQLQQEITATKQNLSVVTQQKNELALQLQRAQGQAPLAAAPKPVISMAPKLQARVPAMPSKPVSSQRAAPKPSIARPIPAEKQPVHIDPELQKYDQALELNPNDINALINRGLAYEAKGGYDRALPDFNKAIAIAPGSMEAYMARGEAYEAEGTYKKAIIDFNRAMKINSQDPSVFYRRGDVYFLKGNRPRAYANWNRALRMDSQNPASGITYYRKADDSKLISDNTKVIKVYPQYALAYYMRGTAWAAKSRPDRAIADFTQAIALNPNYLEAYSDRAIAYFLKHDYAKALDDVQKVRQMGGKVNADFISSLKTASGQGP